MGRGWSTRQGGGGECGSNQAKLSPKCLPGFLQISVSLYLGSSFNCGISILSLSPPDSYSRFSRTPPLCSVVSNCVQYFVHNNLLQLNFCVQLSRILAKFWAQLFWNLCSIEDCTWLGSIVYSIMFIYFTIVQFCVQLCKLPNVVPDSVQLWRHHHPIILSLGTMCGECPVRVTWLDNPPNADTRPDQFSKLE